MATNYLYVLAIISNGEYYPSAMYAKGAEMQEAMFQVQVRLPVQVHQAIKDEAKRQERSVNWLINKILADAAAKQGAQQ